MCDLLTKKELVALQDATIYAKRADVYLLGLLLKVDACIEQGQFPEELTNAGILAREAELDRITIKL